MPAINNVPNASVLLVHTTVENYLNALANAGLISSSGLNPAAKDLFAALHHVLAGGTATVSLGGAPDAAKKADLEKALADVLSPSVSLAGGQFVTFTV